MDSKPGPARLRGLSAHAIALAALFIALGSGAYAALAVNSVGPKQIQPNAVGEQELDKAAVDAENLKKQAVTEAKLAQDAVTRAKLADESVGLEQMDLQNTLQMTQQHLQMMSNVIKAQQISANAIVSNLIEDGTIQPADLSDAASTRLYTDNNDASTVSINTDTAIASLALPAGTYLVSAGVSATHTGNAASTRLECYIPLGGGLVDYAKERLQANAGAEPIIFTKQMLQGPATLTGDTTLVYRCTSTNGSNIDLTTIHFQALRVASIVAQ